MKKIISLLACAIMAKVKADINCRQKDYLGVIGGQDYWVDTIQIAVDINQDLAIGGRVWVSGQTSGYFYLFKALTCDLQIQFQSAKYTQGITAITFSTSQIAMVASSSTDDYLLIINRADPTLAVELKIPNSGWKAVPMGLLTAADDQYFVVYEQGAIQANSVTSVTQTQLQLSIGSQFFKQGVLSLDSMYAVAIDSDGLLVLNKLSFDLAFEFSKYLNFGFTDFTTVNIRLAIDTIFSGLALCANEESSVYFQHFNIADSAFLPQSFLLPGQNSCLAASLKSNVAKFVLMDASLNISFVLIDLATQTSTVLTQQTPSLQGLQSNLDSYAIFSSNQVFILGNTDSLYGTTSNSPMMGFVRQLDQTQQQVSVVILTRENIQEDTQAPSSSIEDLGSYDTDSVILANLPLKIKKNQWTQSYCPVPTDKVAAKVTSTCPYWDILDVKEKVYLNPSIPLEQGVCPQLSDDILDLSTAYTLMAKVCFPNIQSNAPSNIETIPLQYSDYQWRWIDKLTPAFQQSSYKLDYLFYSDNRPIDSVWEQYSAVFTPDRRKNYALSIQSGKDLSQQLLSNAATLLLKNKFSVQCMSVLCPEWMKFDATTTFITASNSEICVDQKSKVVIMNFSSTDRINPAKAKQNTWVFSFTCAKTQSPININLPWPIFYLKNHLTYKYRMTPPSNALLKKARTQLGQTQPGVVAIDDKQTQSVVGSWTADQMSLSIQEAVSRRNDPAKPVLITGTISNKGVVKIAFSREIHLPWYMIVRPEVSSSKVGDGGQTKGDGVKVRLLFKELEYYQAERKKRKKRKAFFQIGVTAQANNQAGQVATKPDDSDKSYEHGYGRDLEDYGAYGGDYYGNNDTSEYYGNGYTSDYYGDGYTDDYYGDDYTGDYYGDGYTGDYYGYGYTGDYYGYGYTGDQYGNGYGSYGGDYGYGVDYGNETDANVEPDPVVDSSAFDVSVVLSQQLAPDQTLVDQTGEIIVPKCNINEYLNTEFNFCNPYQLYFGELKDLISIQIKTTDEKQVVFSWKIISAQRLGIEFQLQFDKPLDILQSDLFQATLDFNALEPSLADGVQFKKNLTKQLPEDIAPLSQQATSSVQAASAAAIVGQLAMQGSLNQVWGMIGGVQLMISIPLLAVNFPANANMLVNNLLMIANFDIPYFNMDDILGPTLWNLGDDDSVLGDMTNDGALIGRLSELGYNTRYLSRFMGSVYIIMVGSICILIVIGVLQLCKKNKHLRMIESYLNKKFLWNFYISLVSQPTLELTISGYFNLKYGSLTKDQNQGNGPYPAQVIDYITSVMIFAAVLLTPILMSIFYQTNFKRLSHESYKSKFGAGYAGLDVSKRQSLIKPMIFAGRRILLMVITIWLQKYGMMQLIIMILVSLLSGCYLVHFKPYLERKMLLLEIFSEVTLMLLLIISINFTDLIADPATQFMVGYAFLFVLIFYLGVQLFLIAKGMFRSTKQKLKLWHHQCRTGYFKNQQSTADGNQASVGHARGSFLKTICMCFYKLIQKNLPKIKKHPQVQPKNGSESEEGPEIQREEKKSSQNVTSSLNETVRNQLQEITEVEEGSSSQLSGSEPYVQQESLSQLSRQESSQMSPSLSCISEKMSQDQQSTDRLIRSEFSFRYEQHQYKNPKALMKNNPINEMIMNQKVEQKPLDFSFINDNENPINEMIMKQHPEIFAAKKVNIQTSNLSSHLKQMNDQCEQQLVSYTNLKLTKDCRSTSIQAGVNML